MSELHFVSLRLNLGAWANLILAALATKPWAMVLFVVLTLALFVADYFCMKQIKKAQP